MQLRQQERGWYCAAYPMFPAIACGWLLAGCGLVPPPDGTTPPDDDDAIRRITETFATSLHGTREGKRTFYEGTREEPGFFSMTGIDYDTLPCADCHAATFADGTPVDPATYEPGCADCHADPDNPKGDVPESVCFGCHGRIGAEKSLADAGVPHMTDVHRDAGMMCMDCHKESQVHGDGNVYTSVQDPDLPRPTCEECHTAGGIGVEPSSTVTEH